MGDDRLYDGDGTQPPAPPSAFADPMTGLAGAVRDDVYQVEIAKPIQPDADAVREMVQAAMANEPDLFGPRTSPEAAPEPSAAAPEPQAETPPPAREEAPTPPGGAPMGVIPRQRTWPARPQQLLRQRLRGARQSAKARVPRSAVPRTPASRGSAGVAIAVVLLILFVVIAIQLVSSLVSGISGIFS